MSKEMNGAEVTELGQSPEEILEGLLDHGEASGFSSE